MGEGQEPAGWTHSNLNAAEVSMTQQWVCGYHTGWASMFLSCLCRGTESRSIHGLDGQKTCSNLSANAPSFLSQTRAHLRLVSSFCQGVLTEWQSVLCVIPQRTAFVSSARGGVGVIPGHFTATKSHVETEWSEWQEEAGTDLLLVHTLLMFLEKNFSWANLR